MSISVPTLLSAKRYSPPALTDVGQPTGRPFVVVLSAQSNGIGQGTGGDTTVQSGIYVTNVLNSASAPTALVPAAYGTAPLNTAPGGTSSTPSACFNNPGVAFANALRSSGMLPASRPIVVVFNVQGAQSISDWVDKSPSDMWTPLQSALALVQATYPGATINHTIWDQAENDQSLTYGTQATYLAAFARLITMYQALPQWTSETTMSVTELGSWSANTQQSRNDALRTLADGNVYPFVTFVSGAGLTMSSDVPGPHYNGVGLNALGQRHFQAWRQARVYGGFSGLRAANGSAHAFPNIITIPVTTTFTASLAATGVLTVSAVGAGALTPGQAIVGTTVPFQTTIAKQLTGTTGSTGTYLVYNSTDYPSSYPVIGSEAMTAGYAVGVDDIRSGGYIDVFGSFTLPNPVTAPPVPIVISTENLASASTVIYSTGSIEMENAGVIANGTAVTLKNGRIYMAIANQSDGRWEIFSLLPRDGNQRWTFPSSSVSSLSLSASSMNHATYILNGVAVTAAWAFGNDVIFYNNPGQADSTISNGGGFTGFILPDGTIETTLTLKAGQLAWCVASVSATNSPYIYVVVLTGKVVQSKVANYTIAATDDLIVMNGTSITATLPDPTATTNWREHKVKNTNSSSLTVVSAGTSKTIDGAASATLAQWAHAVYVSDGTQWLTV